MQHFIFFLWMLLALIPVIIFILRSKNFQKKIIYQYVNNLFINYDCFSTLTAKQVTSYICKQSRPRKKELLKYIFHGNIADLLKHINDSKLKYQLSLLTAKKSSAPKFNQPYLTLLYIKKLIIQETYTQSRRLLHKINEKPRSQTAAALKLYLDAQLAYHDGDLLNASAWCIQAIKLFKKRKFIYEEADTYFLLGQIYQAGEFYDSSELMLRNSLNLFNHLKCNLGAAKCACQLGLLTAAQERWDDAHHFFNISINHSQHLNNHQPYCLSVCYMALLDVTMHNHHNAIKQIISLNTEKYNDKLTAFQNDILAQAYFGLQQWHKTIRYAKQAKKIYLSLNDSRSSSLMDELIEKSATKL